jgi:hypothetical protein
MSTLSARRKAMRGTKRTCLECEAAFTISPAVRSRVLRAGHLTRQQPNRVSRHERASLHSRPRPDGAPSHSSGLKQRHLSSTLWTAPVRGALRPVTGPTTPADEAPGGYDVVLEHEQDAGSSGLIDQDPTESDER